jgi:hypothetical protein
MKRRGYQLTEVVVALAVAAGPLLVGFQLIHSNTTEARFNRDRAVARLLLSDISEILCGETIEQLRDVNRPGALDAVLERRIERIHPAVRKAYAEQVNPYFGQIHAKFQDSTQPGLVELELTTKVGSGADVRVTHLFRPGARTIPDRPATDPGQVAADVADTSGEY